MFMSVAPFAWSFALRRFGRYDNDTTNSAKGESGRFSALVWMCEARSEHSMVAPWLERLEHLKISFTLENFFHKIF